MNIFINTIQWQSHTCLNNLWGSVYRDGVKPTHLANIVAIVINWKPHVYWNWFWGCWIDFKMCSLHAASLCSFYLKNSHYNKFTSPLGMLVAKKPCGYCFKSDNLAKMEIPLYLPSSFWTSLHTIKDGCNELKLTKKIHKDKEGSWRCKHSTQKCITHYHTVAKQGRWCDWKILILKTGTEMKQFDKNHAQSVPRKEIMWRWVKHASSVVVFFWLYFYVVSCHLT